MVLLAFGSASQTFLLDLPTHAIRPIISHLKRLLSLWFKQLNPVSSPFIPRLDPLEDRWLFASHLFAIGSTAGVSPKVQVVDSNTGQTLDPFQLFSSD